MHKTTFKHNLCQIADPGKVGCSSTLTDFCPNSVAEVVAHYKIHRRRRSTVEIQFFTGLRSFDDVLEYVAFAKTPEGKRQRHQSRLKKESLNEVYRQLKRINLSECATFHDLFNFIDKTIKSIHGIGPLMVYDTALRIGAWLGFEPKKVYLHCGTRDGAKAIGLGRGKETLEVSELPREFRRLEPREIEDCLCIYKRDLQRICSI